MADSDVEIGHVRIERRPHVAILDVERGVVQGILGRFAPRVDISVLAEVVLSLADLAVRVATRPRPSSSGCGRLKTSLAVTKWRLSGG